MSLEDFQLLGNEPFDNSIVRRDFLKLYHQQIAILNDPDQLKNSFLERITTIIK